MVPLRKRQRERERERYIYIWLTYLYSFIIVFLFKYGASELQNLKSPKSRRDAPTRPLQQKALAGGGRVSRCVGFRVWGSGLFRV